MYGDTVFPCLSVHALQRGGHERYERARAARVLLLAVNRELYHVDYRRAKMSRYCPNFHLGQRERQRLSTDGA